MTVKSSLYLLLMGVLLTSACASDEATSTEPGELTWISCPDNEALDCATLTVPMSYDSASEQMDIALNRLTDNEQPVAGIVLLDYGVPRGARIKESTQYAGNHVMKNI